MKSRQSGYALIVILLLAALVLIGLSAAVPRLLTQGQREKEEELIFRGEQYKRAIGRFYKKFGRYPTKIEELLETNQRAFLRREFLDPMTQSGKWRLIRVGPLGELIGSVNERKPLRPSGGPAPSGQAPQPRSGGSGSPSPPQTGGSGSAAGSSDGSSPYPLAGVASTSTARSIRLYEGYNSYHQWEFIYDPVKEALGNQPAVPGQPQPNPPSDSEPPS
jgi:type II secretory pathway pseudopilin PulG